MPSSFKAPDSAAEYSVAELGHVGYCGIKHLRCLALSTGGISDFRRGLVVGVSSLAKEMSGGSAPLEVVVDLFPAKNDSGYQWSSPQGPPVGIFGGTMCTGSIIIDRKRPISYVIPLVKEKLGM